MTVLNESRDSLLAEGNSSNALADGCLVRAILWSTGAGLCTVPSFRPNVVAAYRCGITPTKLNTAWHSFLALGLEGAILECCDVAMGGLTITLIGLSTSSRRDEIPRNALKLILRVALTPSN